MAGSARSGSEDSTGARLRPTDREHSVARSEPPEVTTYLRMAGISGLVFAGLFVFAVMLVHRAPALDVPDSVYARFYAAGDQRALVTAGLYVLPFAGIAFLWHTAALRTLVRAVPRTLPAIPDALQLASTVVFICMLFAGSAAVGAVAVLIAHENAPLPPVGVVRALADVGYALVFIYGIRVAGMFMITTTTLARAAGLLPRWLAGLSYVAAVLLLVSTTFHPAIVLAFPGWVVLVSAAVLVVARRPRQAPTGTGVASEPAEFQSP